MAKRVELVSLGIALSIFVSSILIVVNSRQLWQRFELASSWLLLANENPLEPKFRSQTLNLEPVQNGAHAYYPPTNVYDRAQPYKNYDKRDSFPFGDRDERIRESAIKYLQNRVKTQISKKYPNQQGWNWGDFNKFGDDEVGERRNKE